MQMDTLRIKTAIGEIVAKANNIGVCMLDFVAEQIDLPITNTHNKHLKQLEIELTEYFDGKRYEFFVPLAPTGTVFQMSVWQTLQRIPYGTTISYATEAQMLGRPTAVRAVANANGKNPISIIIPCHRVIASDGGIGGYSGGLWRKEFLLELEKRYSLQNQ